MSDPLEFALYGYLAATLLTPGATLSQGVRLMLVLTGVMLGLLGLGAVQHLTNPQNVSVFGPRLLHAVLSLCLMLIPAWCVLDGRHRPRLSVADGFLLGFLPGFGADCVQAMAQRAPLQPTWLIPGGQLQQGYWAGYGWWCGAITLTWCAAYRFGKSDQLAQLLGSLAFGWVLVDRLSAGQPLPPYSTVQGLVLVGATVWALIHLGLHERYWVRRSVGYRNLLAAPEMEVPPLGEVLRQLGPPGLVYRWRALARRKQVLIERQELVDMGRVTIDEVPRAFRVDTGGADLKTWILRALATTALFYAVRGPAGSIFEPLMAGLILLNYVLAPDLEPDDADPAVRITVESLLLNSSLCAVLLWYFLGTTDYPRDCPAVLPQTWELLLAVAFFTASWAGSQQRGARAFWRPRHRRLAVLHRCLTLTKCGLVCYGLVALYPAYSKMVQKSVGHPNPWLNLLAGLALGAVAALAAHLVNQLGDHIVEKFQKQS